MKNTAVRNIALYLLTLSCFIAQAQDTTGKFTLNGKVTGQDTGYVRLSYLNKEHQVIQDSTPLENGNFCFTGYVTVPTVAFFKSTTSNHVDDPNSTEIFLEPAEMYAVVKANDFKNAHITGSNTQTEYEEVNKQKEPIKQEMQSLETAFTNNRMALQKDQGNAVLIARDDSIRAAFSPFRAQFNKIDYEFIATHPTSYLSAYFMFYDLEDWSLDSAKTLYTGLSPAVQKSFLGERVGRRLQAKEPNTVQRVVQDFSKKDINGKDISIASFKGKNILLIDFWASWCGPCRQGNPHLIELYRKYHDKGFDVISISVDKDEAAWKGAIAKDNIDSWHHVLDNSLAKNLNITLIPTQLLIDKHGTIVGRFEGFDPNAKESELDIKLAQLISQNNK